MGTAAEVELTAGPEGTEAIGARIAAGLRPGDIVLVEGELGSGKTTLIRGACRELAVAEPVTSPTFTIGQRYAGRSPVSHVDLFRVASLEGEDPALLDDYLAPDTICFIEWPRLAEATGALDPARVRVRVVIEHAGGEQRRVSVTWT